MADGDDGDKKGDDHLYSLPASAMCGGCEIVRPLGAGGCAEVYLAIDPRGEECALKRMQLSNRDDQKTRRRFLQEAGILHGVSHPNVVRCDAYGADTDGTLWMKLEYLRGVTLRELLHREGTLPIEKVLRLGRQVCRGLSELHEAGAVHRDLKPDNLFFVEEVDLLKILDFGLVKLPGSGLKTTGRIALGTALYFAPDYLRHDPQVHGDDPDPRWDVYSLAITLYEMLVAHPFALVLGKFPPPMVAAKMHLMHEIPDLAEQGIPAWVAAPIMRALSLDPDERYQDSVAFELALREVHEKWLATRARETPAPRTASARVRLGNATTEPEVMSQLTRSVVLPEAETSKVAEQPAKNAAAGTVPAPAQVTERMFIPPALVRSPKTAPPSPPPEVRAITPMPEPAVARRSIPIASNALRTEPLDRSMLPALQPSRQPAEEPGEAARASTAARASDVNIGRTKPPSGHDAPLPATDHERDVAELAFWLRTGHLPPDIAAKLGLRVVSATAPEDARRASRASTVAERAPAKAAKAAAWRARWEAIPKLASVVLLLLSCGLLTYEIAQWYGVFRSRPSAQAEGPIAVPLPPEPPAPASKPPASGGGAPAPEPAPPPAVTAAQHRVDRAGSRGDSRAEEHPRERHLPDARRRRSACETEGAAAAEGRAPEHDHKPAHTDRHVQPAVWQGGRVGGSHERRRSQAEGPLRRLAEDAHALGTLGL